MKHVRVVRGPTLRGDIVTAVGVMPAETLVELAEVPLRNPLKKSGYQREPSASRISNLAREIQDGHVDLPTAVLLNIRGMQADDLLECLGDDEYHFRLEQHHRLKVVDGQHRIAALKRARETLRADIGNVKIPFVCMIGADEMQEMEQFHVVNSNAKAVPTNLALEIMKERYQNDPEGLGNRLKEKGEQWKVDAQEIAENLNKISYVWKEKIRFANMKVGDTTVPSAGFVKSLKPVLDSVIFRKLAGTNEERAKMLHAYWVAVERVVPDAFESPKKYTLQKGQGANILHGIYPAILDSVRSGTTENPNAQSYEPYLKAVLLDMSGTNSAGDLVAGQEFWRSGRYGVIANYSGRGQQQLIGIMIDRLRELEND